MTSSDFQQLQHKLPTHPGIYKYYDAGGTLIYVGKAKNIRKRVSSYFSRSFQSFKTHELVQRIENIEFTIVNSEQDAFLLENSLIKEFQPKYNINLKDDKTYPYIVIRKENFPRVFFTRRRIADGSEYLGPFTSVGRVRELLDLAKQNIPLRNCKLNLSPQAIRKGNYKVCLEYHLGNCKGPCEGLQTEEEYAEGLQRVREIMKGNLSPVLNHFRIEMKLHVERMEFEKAQLVKKKIDHLQSYQAKSTIVNQRMGDVDVFSMRREEEQAFVNFLMVRNGTIVQTHTVPVEIKVDEPEEQLLGQIVERIRDTFHSHAREIIVSNGIEYPKTGITITIPKGGDKKQLLELSEKNVEYFIAELRRRKTLQLEGRSDMEKKAVVYQLQKDLQLSVAPVHIECFDNSNFQGSFPVSAMVCFRDGMPYKKEYRHFNVKSVEGINDFATMKEVVYRRYKRLKEERADLPQLVIIDGGKGQLSAALESIRELNLSGQMTLVGLAKNVEEIFFAGDSESLKLPYGSDSLKLIRQIRDEVHRFGITFHRQQRSKGTFRNALEEIEGIGPATAEALLGHFRSVKKVSEASIEALSSVIGEKKAQKVFENFHPGA